MKHYYFKFGEKNHAFQKWIDKYGIDRVELSIYYDVKDILMWRAKDSDIAIKYFKEIRDSKSASQIDLFYGLNRHIEDSYFWIFENEKIYAFKGEELNVIDGVEHMIDPNGSRPKSITVRLYKVFEKIELPEFFSNINSNQKYNRGTIAEFPIGSSENEFATALIKESTLSIDRTNFHKYLSPIEFETLIFLIFNCNGNYCSSFRGGTLKDYDLRVIIKNNSQPSLLPVINGRHWIQTKKKSGNMKSFNGYVISTNENSSTDSRVLGLDWIRGTIDKNQHLIEWLKQTTFRGEGFNYIDFNW